MTSKRIVQRSTTELSADQFPDLPPLLRRIYAARGVTDPAQLDLSLAALLPPATMKGMDKAVVLLVNAFQQQQKILIVGDFDADGATSTAVATRALQGMGAREVNYLVPNRFEYGYGLTPEIVAVAAEQQPDLLITVDNGISSLDGVTAAQAAGIKVLITDHHLAGDTLPSADAIVNPNQPGCEFASKHIAGVGVIFYVMLGLRSQLREQGWFAEQGIPGFNLATLLDLVALGTVADVVALDRNNRILVDQGLKRIRANQSCAGIRALLGIARRDYRRLVASDLGFAVGPRLNAAGRLEDMALGIECLLTEQDDAACAIACLLTEQDDAACAIASRLNDLNQERKGIEAEMKQQALALLETIEADAEILGPTAKPRSLATNRRDYRRLVASDPDDWSGVCLYDPDWHQGVIGILAGRIKDRMHRPVIAFARTEPGQLKGSARSVAGVHIRDVLDEIAKQHPELLSKFGGHAMAAGLAIAEQDYPQFAAAFNETVDRHLSAENRVAQVMTDGELAVDELNLEVAHQLRQAGPWGQQFTEPLFDGRFKVLQQRLVGEQHLKMVLQPLPKESLPEGAVSSSAPAVDAIQFFIDLEQWPNEAQEIRLVYRADVNEFRGEQSLQLVGEYIEAL